MTDHPTTHLLTPAPPEAVDDAWVAVALRLVHEAISSASAGQCLRLGGLPRQILERLATALSGTPPAETEIYLIDTEPGPETWRVGVHKVVERRNESEAVVVALVPPDIQLAAQDSVDISTFREVSLRGADSAVSAALLEALPPEQRELASAVLADLNGRRWPIRPSARHAYLCQILHQSTTAVWPVGASLFELGLIPDFDLGAVREAIPHRLGQLNIDTVGDLTERARTPMERVLRLPIERSAHDATASGIEADLLALFARHDSSNVRAWGRDVATDPAYRHLALELWPLENVEPPGFVRIDLHPLKLPAPRRRAPSRGDQ